jgi:hypothetical protein
MTRQSLPSMALAPIHPRAATHTVLARGGGLYPGDRDD